MAYARAEIWGRPSEKAFIMTLSARRLCYEKSRKKRIGAAQRRADVRAGRQGRGLSGIFAVVQQNRNH